MRRLVRALVASALVAVAAAQPLAVGSAAAATRLVDRPCSDVEAIFARGSGQGLNERQYTRFVTQLDERIGGDLTFDAYELGTESYGDAQYPAVNVSDILNGNAIGGKLSGGQAFDYGDSVWAGATEYAVYLIDRAYNCPDTVFVAGGFSQGAQVVGQAYGYLPEETRDRIIFNALFGDPKLYLPEGEGLFPPACRGDDLSPWRRTVPNCRVDNGSLGARKPYLPDGWTDRTGLWCADDDFVCGSTKKPWKTSGHDYAQEGGGIDEAAIEIAGLLRERFPEEDPTDFDTSIHIFATGTTGLDVVFIIDSTGSMGGRIAGAKAFAASMADKIAALRGRVALVEYKDAGDPFVSQTLSGLSSDVTDFNTKLAGITASGGGDTPEALLAGLMSAFNDLDWRPGATKAAVVLTDAGYHNPDAAYGYTLDQVVARSLEIDPVNVYPVVPSYMTATYAGLADATSGKVIEDSGDTSAALESALTQIAQRPVPLLSMDEYFAQPGESVTFDASRSYATQGEIASYRWDFDGDGTFDTVTDTPTVSHVYPSRFDGVMQVRVTDTKGGLASHSVPVHVLPADELAALTATQPAPTDLTARALKSGGGASSVALSWKPAGDPPAKWAVAVNGVWIGTTTSDKVTVTDVERADDVTFSVAPMAVDDTIGDAAQVVLPADGTSGDGAPVAVDQSVKVRKDTVRPILLLSGGHHDGLTFATQDPSHGTLEVRDRHVKYVPEPGFVGQDSFTFTVTDEQGRSDSGTVRINVTGHPLGKD